MIEEYVTISYLNFEDGSASAMELHRGSRKDCKFVADEIPAVNYSGDKKVSMARMCVVPAKEFDEITEQK